MPWHTNACQKCTLECTRNGMGLNDHAFKFRETEQLTFWKGGSYLGESRTFIQYIYRTTPSLSMWWILACLTEIGLRARSWVRRVQEQCQRRKCASLQPVSPGRTLLPWDGILDPGWHVCSSILHLCNPLDAERQAFPIGVLAARALAFGTNRAW